MTGNNKRRGLVVQPRDRKLLEELAIMRVVDREQAKIVAGFGSTTRANARLLALTRAGLLRRFFLGSRKSLYALSEKGAQLAEVPLRGPRRRQDETLVADFFIEHQLAINNVYCAVKCGVIPVEGVSFRRWLAFQVATFDGKFEPNLRFGSLGFRIRKLTDKRRCITTFSPCFG